jgi:hypothetical protein
VSGRFLGPLPERGVWTAAGLGRGHFLAILALSVALFLFVDGPLWAHLHDRHLLRIAVSYGVIPPAVAVALHRRGTLGPLVLVTASAVVALVKLVLTAGILIVLALAH